MERILLSFSLLGKTINIDIYAAMIAMVFLTYGLLWGGYMASWRAAIYGVDKKYYPPYFKKFLANQKLLLLLLAIPIVQIPWLFVLLFALRRAMINHGKAMATKVVTKVATKNDFLFFTIGIMLMLLQFLGGALLAGADNNQQKWLAIGMQLFLLLLALWHWWLMHRLQYQLRKK